LICCDKFIVIEYKNTCLNQNFSYNKMPKDACYYEAKEKYAVFPSGYASGYIAKCRKRKGIVNKSDKGYALKRWYAEDWRDEQGNICGSPTNENIKKCRPRKRIDNDTPVTWDEMSEKEKKRAVEEKKQVGMGARAGRVKSKEEETTGIKTSKTRTTSPKRKTRTTSPKRKTRTTSPKRKTRATSPKRNI
jgi:hypothetical protein